MPSQKQQFTGGLGLEKKKRRKENHLRDNVGGDGVDEEEMIIWEWYSWFVSGWILKFSCVTSAKTRKTRLD